MTLGIECLLCDDPAQARELAAVLDRINAERRAVQQQMVGEAETALATVPDVVATPRVAHCLFDAQWHPGVIGLVASKLKERLHRPVIAFAPSEPGSTVLRGSARSIPGFHVRDALARVDAMQPGLIDRFGGHAMAAGLSLPQAHFADFEAAFLEAATAMIAPEALHETIARRRAAGRRLPHPQRLRPARRRAVGAGVSGTAVRRRVRGAVMAAGRHPAPQARTRPARRSPAGDRVRRLDRHAARITRPLRLSPGARRLSRRRRHPADRGAPRIPGLSARVRRSVAPWARLLLRPRCGDA